MDYKELKEVLERLNKTVAMAQKANSVSLDETLTSVNETLIQVGSLLEVVQVAILIIAVAFSILLIGITATCYYAKYKKYNRPRVLQEESITKVENTKSIEPTKKTKKNIVAQPYYDA